MGNRKIVDIACGEDFALAVSAEGAVWGWGANKHGQVGIGKDAPKVPSPTRILFEDGPKIKKIACGSNHGLAVSETGFLYTWGDNSHGQLGNGTTMSSNSPRKIVLDNNNYSRLIASTDDEGTTKVAMANVKIRVVDVAAHATQDLSLALTQQNEVFMWGNCRGIDFLQPVKMSRHFKDLDSAFVACSTEPIMLRPITISADEQAGGPGSVSQGASILKALRNAFDDPETSDVKFMVEEKPIHAHKSVLTIRSEYFRRMFSSEWKEAEEGVVEIPDVAYDVYKAYLTYLYTGELDVDATNAMKLVNLAQSHLQEDLVSMCVDIIREGITIENAVEVWDEAIRASAKDVEEMCLKYLTNNLTSAINSGLLDKLGEHRVKEFFEKAAKAGALP